MFTIGLLFAAVVAIANAQAPGMMGAPMQGMGMQGMGMQGMGMQGMQGGNSGMAGMNNFNLSTPEGIQGFLAMENINPASIITTNCVPNGNPCSPSGTPCCISPVMICQPSPAGANMCLVDPQHREHIPMIQQILRTVGYTTQNPIQ